MDVWIDGWGCELRWSVLAVCEICELAIFEHDTESRTFPRMNV